MIFSKPARPIRPLMDVFSYEIPLLGQFFLMFADVLRFRISENRHLSFFSDRKNDPFRCPLFTRHPHHKKVLAHLEGCAATMPFLLKRVSRRQYALSVGKNAADLRFVANMIRVVFDVRQVEVEACLSSDDNYLGRCGFHLSDLYEMGYATLTPAIVSRPAAFANYDVHTGFLLHAQNPLQHYPEDYVHLDLSCHNQNGFFILSLQNLILHRPGMMKALRPIVADTLRAIPLNDLRKVDSFLSDWDYFYCFEVRPRHLATPVRDWKPGLFLLRFSRILDLFHAYTLTQHFSAHFVL